MKTYLIETISPEKVYNRFLLGLMLLIGSLVLWDNILSQYDPIFKWALLISGCLFVLTSWNSIKNPGLAIRYVRNPVGVICDLIDEWSPGNISVEHELEKSLHYYLKKHLPWEKLTRQYGTGRVKCDIAVGKKVMLELKSGFRSTQKLQRLIGQLELYRNEWAQPIIVVLAGETDEDLLHDLHLHVRRLNDIKIIIKENIQIERSSDEK